MCSRGKGLSQTFKCQYVGYLYLKCEIERSFIMWKYKPPMFPDVMLLKNPVNGVSRMPEIKWGLRNR
jgi:hypothetical protein